MLHFVLLRHGETDWTRQKRYQGHSDTELNAVGRRQVQRFVKEVTRYQPDIIFSSQLSRSKESAEILCAPLNIKPTVDERLSEVSFGSWEGKTADELIAAGDARYQQWMNREPVTPTGGESIASLKKRIKSFIRFCVKEHDNKKIIIVTHGGAIRMFLTELLSLPLETVFQFRIDPGSMTILGVYDYSRQLVVLNSSSPNNGIVPAGCC